MLFGVPIEVLVGLVTGPVSALIVALIMAYAVYSICMKMMARDDSRFERMLTVFEDEVKACEARYRQVLQELFKLNGGKKDVL